MVWISCTARCGSRHRGSEPPPAQLGDFRILREVGRGGMGVVYEAEQISLGRRVALKVLPFAAALDARHLQRFKNEAQAAAHLHHSNIVPVFAVGCDRGVHYYAMQFIDGQTLADVIRQMRQDTPPEVPADTESYHASLMSRPRYRFHHDAAASSLHDEEFQSRPRLQGAREVRRPSGRRPRICPRHGRHSPRHQAGQLAY